MPNPPRRSGTPTSLGRCSPCPVGAHPAVRGWPCPIRCRRTRCGTPWSSCVSWAPWTSRDVPHAGDDGSPWYRRVRLWPAVCSREPRWLVPGPLRRPSPPWSLGNAPPRRISRGWCTHCGRETIVRHPSGGCRCGGWSRSPETRARSNRVRLGPVRPSLVEPSLAPLNMAGWGTLLDQPHTVLHPRAEGLPVTRTTQWPSSWPWPAPRTSRVSVVRGRETICSPPVRQLICRSDHR